MPQTNRVAGTQRGAAVVPWSWAHRGEILQKMGLFEREKCGKNVRLYWDIPVNYGKNVEKLWKNVEKTSKKVGKYGKIWKKRWKILG